MKVLERQNLIVVIVVHVKAILFSIFFYSNSLVASPEIEYWNTSNGTEVYYVHAPQLPMVDIQIIFDAGSIRDDGQLGIAMLSNSLLAEGDDGLDADMISKCF